MSSATPAPWRGFLRRLLRPVVLGLLAILVAIARGLAGPRYQPPPTPRNQPTEVERKR